LVRALRGFRLEITRLDGSMKRWESWIPAHARANYRKPRYLRTPFRCPSPHLPDLPRRQRNPRRKPRRITSLFRARGTPHSETSQICSPINEPRGGGLDGRVEATRCRHGYQKAGRRREREIATAPRTIVINDSLLFNLFTSR